MVDYIKSFLSRFGYEKTDERGDMKIGGGRSPDFEIEDTDRGRASVNDLEWYYHNYGPLFRGINLKAASVWGRGFKIVSDNKKAKELCSKMTLAIPTFKQWVITESAHAFTYGGGPGEIIWDDVNELDKDNNLIKDKDDFIKKKEEGKNIIGYNVTDPKTFKPKWDVQGYINYWVQKIISKTGSEDVTKHKPRHICLFKFHQIADNVAGIGLIEPNLTTVKALMTAQKSTNDLLFRHGIPFVHVIKQGATAKDIPKLSKIGKEFSNKTHLASSEKISIELKGVEGKSVDISPHISLLEGNLAGGLGIPKPILYYAGEAVNRATLTELMTATSIEIKTYQEKLSDIIENQIFRPALDANSMEGVSTPQVIWNSLDEKGDTEVLENFKIFSEAMFKAVQSGMYTADEAKKISEERFKFIKENSE